MFFRSYRFLSTAIEATLETENEKELFREGKKVVKIYWGTPFNADEDTRTEDYPETVRKALNNYFQKATENWTYEDWAVSRLARSLAYIKVGKKTDLYVSKTDSEAEDDIREYFGTCQILDPKVTDNIDGYKVSALGVFEKLDPLHQQAVIFQYKSTSFLRRNKATNGLNKEDKIIFEKKRREIVNKADKKIPLEKVLPEGISLAAKDALTRLYNNRLNLSRDNPEFTEVKELERQISGWVRNKEEKKFKAKIKNLTTAQQERLTRHFNEVKKCFDLMGQFSLAEKKRLQNQKKEREAQRRINARRAYHRNRILRTSNHALLTPQEILYKRAQEEKERKYDTMYDSRINNILSKPYSSLSNDEEKMQHEAAQIVRATRSIDRYTLDQLCPTKDHPITFPQFDNCVPHIKAYAEQLLKSRLLSVNDEDKSQTSSVPLSRKRKKQLYSYTPATAELRKKILTERAIYDLSDQKEIDRLLADIKKRGNKDADPEEQRKKEEALAGLTFSFEAGSLDRNKLFIAYTGPAQLGLFARTVIKKGTPFALYTGDLMGPYSTQEELEEKIDTLVDTSYLLELSPSKSKDLHNLEGDDISNDASSEEKSKYSSEKFKKHFFAIDAYTHRGLAAFANCSDFPNAKINIINGRPWLVAQEDIYPGHEITHTYGTRRDFPTTEKRAKNFFEILSQVTSSSDHPSDNFDPDELQVLLTKNGGVSLDAVGNFIREHIAEKTNIALINKKLKAHFSANTVQQTPKPNAHYHRILQRERPLSTETQAPQNPATVQSQIEQKPMPDSKRTDDQKPVFNRIPKKPNHTRVTRFFFQTKNNSNDASNNNSQISNRRQNP